MNVRATRFPLFDSLRAIAALSVLATHAAFFAGVETNHPTRLSAYAARLAIGGGITPAWSLTIEVAFYVFLPIWAGLMVLLFGRDSRGSVRAETGGLILLFCIAIAWKLVVLGNGDAHHVEITPALIALPAYL